MTVSLPGRAVVAVLVVAGALCACTPVKKDASTQPIQRETYKPTGSHIVERRERGRRSPANSSSAPVQDLKDTPAVTVIQNQAPK
jgi:hypothetical protein